MARRQVVEVSCDRCKRIEVQTEEDFKGIARDKETGPEFSLTMHGEKTTYKDLCRSCRKTLGNYRSKIINVGKEKAIQGPPPAAKS